MTPLDSTAPSIGDVHVALTSDLVSTQIAIWLLELRQKDVHQQLRLARNRRAALGREYRRQRRAED